MSQIKITNKQFKKVLNEVIGFTTSYEDEAMGELKELIKGIDANYYDMINYAVFALIKLKFHK